MFQTFIKLLTAATFVAHGLLGCCWHHTHSHAVGAERSVAKSGGCHGHGHHHGHHSAGKSTTENDDHRNHDSGAPHDPGCSEGHCVFARTQDSVKSVVNVHLAFVPVFVAAFPLDVAGLAESDRQALDALGATPPLPAPLHALRQVWLI